MTIVPINGLLPCLKCSPRPAGRRARMAAVADTGRAVDRRCIMYGLATGHEGMQEPVVGATADGRKSGEFFSSSLAPSPDVLVQGPLRVLQRFGRLAYKSICNGGQLDPQLLDRIFRRMGVLC